MSRLQTIMDRTHSEDTVCDVGYRDINAKGYCFTCYWQSNACEATSEVIKTHHDLTQVLRTVYE